MDFPQNIEKVIQHEKIIVFGATGGVGTYYYH